MLGILQVDAKAKLQALDRSQMVAEFGVDGTLLAANANFLRVFGYSLSEVKGRNHSLFVGPSLKQSDEYRQFWMDLRAGNYKTANCERVAKDGRTLWLQATYTPVIGQHGKVVKIVKFATDITESTLCNIDHEGQILALHRSQAIAEFGVDGTILYANDNFLNAFGYRLDEVVGHHHSMFVDDATRRGEEYRRFWEGLSNGCFQAAEYKRVGKNGREVFIQATYNPIRDRDGNTLKIVKVATNVTEAVQERRQRALLQDTMKRGLDAISAAFDDVSRQADRAQRSAAQVASDVATVIGGAETCLRQSTA